MWGSPGACSIVVPVTDKHDKGKDLEAYMRLPVSQYVLIDVPLGGSLARVSHDLFDVVVAPVRFFDLWVQPHVRCQVRWVPCAPMCTHVTDQPSIAPFHQLM